MKTAKLERTFKRQLASLGLEIRPDSPAARGLSRTARLGTRDVRVVVLPQSRHIVTRDLERAAVAAELSRFLERFPS